jgi:hypothetical protein
MLAEPSGSELRLATCFNPFMALGIEVSAAVTFPSCSLSPDTIIHFPYPLVGNFL